MNTVVVIHSLEETQSQILEMHRVYWKEVWNRPLQAISAIPVQSHLPPLVLVLEIMLAHPVLVVLIYPLLLVF